MIFDSLFIQFRLRFIILVKIKKISSKFNFKILFSTLKKKFIFEFVMFKRKDGFFR